MWHIEVGQTRLKFGGGPGGHNGLRSLIQHLGGDRDFGRLRIGVGHPGSSKDLGSVSHANQNAGARTKNAHLESSYLDDQLLKWLFTGDWQKAMTKTQFRAKRGR